MNEDKLNSWLRLRFDYYLAGRTLLFSNQLQTGVLMLGYAIEAHLKQLLSSAPSFKMKLQFGHDFYGAFNELKDKGYLADVRVSDDLLYFVEDNFHRRYPIQTEQTIERANSRGHAVCMSPTVIFAYDDFIMQLDDAVTTHFETARASVLVRGIQNVDVSGGQYFFHCNYAVRSLIDDGIELSEKWLNELRQNEPNIYDLNRQSHNERMKLLADPDALLVFDKAATVVYPGQHQDSYSRAAELFEYPGKFQELPDGTRISIASF